MNKFIVFLKMLGHLYKSMLAAAGLSFLTVAANIGLLATSAYLISAAALQPPLSALSASIVGVRFFGLARAVLRYLERYVSHTVTFNLLAQIRLKTYAALEPLVPAVISGFKSSEIFGSIVNNVETLQYFYLRVLLPPATAGMTLLALLAVFWQINRELAGLTALAFILGGLGLPGGFYLAKISRADRLPQQKALLTNGFVDSLKGLRDLAAFGQTEKQLQRVMAANEAYMQCQFANANLAGLAEAGGSLLVSLSLIGAVGCLVPAINDGQLEGVFFATLVLGLQSSFEALLPMTLAYRYWEESLAALSRLSALTGANPAVSITQGIDEPLTNYDLCIDKVRLRYPGRETAALSELSFALRGGQKMAVVGASGAGKSSIAALLLRFVDYQQGFVSFGGKELKNLTPAQLANRFGVVLQEDYIFFASLADNIRLARPAATEEELLRAAEQAGLQKVIARLPEGFNTLVGENGFGLSGGEKRRIALARVLLKDAPVVILDEPTAGLDPVTEREVLGALDKACTDKSLILITHRLSGLENMDNILVLEHGRIAEQGTCAELMHKQGLFYRMRQLQEDLLHYQKV